MKPVEARIRNSVSQSFKKLNPQLFTGTYGGEDDEEHALIEAIASMKPAPAKKRIRQSDKPLLNELENEYFQRTRSLLPNATILPQAIRFRLGNGIWFKPDIAIFTNGALEVCEVKGPHAFRGGFENLKVAAGLYKEVRFFLVWKDERGQWQEQEVLP